MSPGIGTFEPFLAARYMEDCIRQDSFHHELEKTVSFSTY